MEDLFQKVTRLKLRFTAKDGLKSGVWSVEDLWDLDTKNLKIIFGTIAREARYLEDDFISELQEEDIQANKHNGEYDLVSLKRDVVKHIYKIKKAEQNASLEATLKAAKKQKLLGFLAQKEDDSFLLKSPEEIQAMIEEL